MDDNKFEHDIHKIDVAIVGAGNVDAGLADELLRNLKSHYVPYCFIDRDLQKIDYGINDLPVIPEDENIIERIKELLV